MTDSIQRTDHAPDQIVRRLEPESDDWAVFTLRLAAYLSTMDDRLEQDNLIVSSPEASTLFGTSPYAQVAGFARGAKLRAELSGNYYLTPDDELDALGLARLADLGWVLADDDENEHNHHLEAPVGQAPAVARRIVVALSEVFHVPHPELLTVKAWGPAAAGAVVLGLQPTDDVPVDVVDASPTPEVVFATDRDDLVHRVHTWLNLRFAATLDGEDVPVDDDGDFVLTEQGPPYWVRVRPDQPAIEIMACVVPNVRSRRQAAIELGLLNRDQVWTRWVLRDRSVWLHLMISARPWVPSTADAMLSWFMAALAGASSDLELRLGGASR